MKAIVIEQPGGPEVMKLGEIADPVPGPEDLLVRIRATALNRADTLQRRGAYPPPPGAPETLGLEMAGEIETLGANVSGWQGGERVMALLGGGGYAEKVVIPAAMAVRIPDRLSFEEAGAVPEAFLTAYLNLFMLGDLQSGQRVLVHAGGSGVGTAAIQEAKLAGATVFTTVSSAEKAKRCRELGADVVINYKEENFAERIQAETKGQGVNIILDFIGAPYYEGNINALGLEGRLILIGQLGGGKVQADLGAIMRKRIMITGTTLRSQTLERKIEITRRFAEFGLNALADGTMKAIVDKVFPLAEAAAAHRYMEEGQNFGKIVLKV
jgi:putative PIG3 family NAD(P)H quinone oxidoreductase